MSSGFGPSGFEEAAEVYTVRFSTIYNVLHFYTDMSESGSVGFIRTFLCSYMHVDSSSFFCWGRPPRAASLVSIY